MELIDHLLARDKAAAEAPLRRLGMKRPETAYENLQNLGAGVTPPEFGGLVEVLVELLPSNADPDRALNNLERFHHATAGVLRPVYLAQQRPAFLELLLGLFGFSQFMSDVLIRYPHYVGWLASPGVMEAVPRRAEIDADLALAMASLGGRDARQRGAIRWLRQMLTRLGAQVMSAKLTEPEFTHQLSEYAAALTQLAVDIAREELTAKFGRPMEEDEKGRLARPAEFCVIAMGKFGAMELNFSSDIDLMFIYSAEGMTEGRETVPGAMHEGRIPNHAYFCRLAEQAALFLGEMTAEGYLYRVDTRLRPEGDDGPLARSMASFEIYHEAQARLWERMAMIKAKAIAGDAGLCERFDTMSRALVFGRLVDADIIRHVRDLKKMIDAGVEAGASAGREIKRGAGGIREIEFYVQAMQLIHGPHDPALRERGTIEAARALVNAGKIAHEECEQMIQDYTFLRVAEHRLQMMDLRQTHTLPRDAEEVEAIARRCGLKGTDETTAGERLEALWIAIKLRVHRRFVDFFGAEGEGEGGAEGTPEARAARAILREAPEKDLIPLLSPSGLEDAGCIASLRRLAGLGRGLWLDAHGREMAESLLPRMIRAAGAAARPAAALAQLESFLEASGAPGAVYEVFRANENVLDLLLKAFGAAASAAQTLLAHPEYADYIANPSLIAETPTAEEFGERLDQWKPRTGTPVEAAATALARVRRFEYLTAALAEFGGIITPHQGAERLTLTAERCCAGALQAAAASLDLELKDGAPAGFAVLAMGKLGTRELNYFSDLDLIFCWDDAGGQITDESAGELAARTLEMLTAATRDGAAYVADARLRPEGQNGPLAPPVSRYAEYYAERAELWEMQSATKLRFIAGDALTGAECVGAILRATRGRIEAMAREGGIAEPIRAMRLRMEASVKIPKWVISDFKKGFGGVVDLEFLAQYFQLRALAERREIAPLRPDQVFAECAARGVLDAAKAVELSADYQFLRLLESRSRLLFETEKSHAPAGDEKWESLARAMEDPRRGAGLRDHLLEVLRRNRANFNGLLAAS